MLPPASQVATVSLAACSAARYRPGYLDPRAGAGRCAGAASPSCWQGNYCSAQGYIYSLTACSKAYKVDSAKWSMHVIMRLQRPVAHHGKRLCSCPSRRCEGQSVEGRHLVRQLLG